jgi:hypothetical protein
LRLYGAALRFMLRSFAARGVCAFFTSQKTGERGGRLNRKPYV